MSKLNYPSWYKTTLHSNFDNAPDLLNNDKIIGFTPTLSNISLLDTKKKGVSHFYTRNGIQKDERFETILGGDFGFSFNTTSIQAYLNGVNNTSSFSKKSVLTDQITEGSGNIPHSNYWSRATAFYKGASEYFGSINKDDNNMFGSYVDEFNNTTGTNKFNLNVGGYTSTPLHPYFKDFLSSYNEATKHLIKDGLGNVSKEIFPFFQQQGNYPSMSSFMNLLTLAYNGMNEPDDSMVEYQIFYEIQKKLAANINTLIYHWMGSESIALDVDSQAKNSGWIIKRNDIENNAYFKFKDTATTSPYKTMFFAYFGFLLGKGIVNWDSVRENYSKNPIDLKNDEYLNGLGYISWYAPSSQQPSWNQGLNDYPTRPHSIQDLYLVAYDWYLKTKNKIDSENIELCYLDYNDGVKSSNVNTSLTNDKRIFTKTIKPYGQHNILYLADQRKPLVIGGGNKNSYIVIYYDPFGNPLTNKTLSVKLNNEDVIIGNVSSRNLQVFIK